MLILESIYEPSFSIFNNNFEKKQCYTSTLRKIKNHWKNVRWIIQGDFNNYQLIINPQILIKILRRKIQDETFLQLLWNLLQSKLEINKPLGIYRKDNKLEILLLNIYLSEFDIILEELEWRINKFKVKENQISLLTKEFGAESHISNCDSITKKIHLIRSGGMWIIAVSGCKKVAKKVTKIISLFLTKKLALRPEPIQINYLPKSKIRFLAYLLIKKKQYSGNTRVRLEQNKKTTRVNCLAPVNDIIEELASKHFCTTLGKGLRKIDWILCPEKTIIIKYNDILLRLKKHYFLADNYATSIKRLSYILRFSCAHTLAGKHRSNVSTQIKRLDQLHLDNTSSIPKKTIALKNGLTVAEILLRFFIEDSKRMSKNICLICSINKNLESHNIKTVNKENRFVENLAKDTLIYRLNKKQSYICKTCQSELHRRNL